jgi:DNA helicase-4
MQFVPGFLGALLTGAGKWEATLSPGTFDYVSGKGETKRIAYELIHDVIRRPGVIWDEVIIKSQMGEVRLDGLTGSNTKRFTDLLRTQVSDVLVKQIEATQDFLQFAAGSFESLLRKPQYLSHHDLAVWAEETRARYGSAADTALRTLKNPLFPPHRAPANLGRQLDLLNQAFDSKGTMVHARNEKFVISESREHEQFFNEVESTPLTDEQRRAAVVMEDRNLLIAAAGSGKTSSVVGKIGYALKRQLVSPEEILVLAFNRHAASELEARISDRLAKYLAGRPIKVKTFHALGLEIISEVENAKPSVPDFVSDSGGAGKILIGDLISELGARDPSFAQDWVFFNTIYPRSAEDPVNIKDAREWTRYVKETGEYENGKNGYRTLNGELVKSQGELAIANWLFTKGVHYEYERPYEYRTADKQYRQYQPDFYLSEIETYLEHYALDANGNPPAAFGDKYAQSIEWKRALHGKKGTDVIETYFSEFVSGDLFPKLESELARKGAKLRPRSLQEIQARMKEWLGRVLVELPGLILTFIKHAKSNQVSSDVLASRAENHRQRARARYFVNVVRKLISEYEKKLAASGSVDFEDMIINAARYANDGSYRHSCRLILVDEFQDISRARANLLIGLLKHSPECKMFAVGDDWQSIYRFAGSDIGVFTNFAENFGATATNFLTQTFRSNQGIAEVAARFIQQNNAQVRKSVVASDRTTDSVIVIRKVEKWEHVPAHILACLEDAAAGAIKFGERQSVFLLGRYNHQFPNGSKEWREKFERHLDLEFKTIHGSKGLQADYVILLGMQGGKLGFPSLIADDPLLELVMPQPEVYPHAEERRLFYVALTRARHRVYLLVSKYLPSCFAEELEGMADIEAMLTYPDATPGDSAQPSERCPQCRKGWLRKVSGKFGPFYGCSEYPTCRYTRDVAADGLTGGSKASGSPKYH